MKIQNVKKLQVLLFALAGVSMLAFLPQAKSAWSGVKEVYSEQDFGLHILREAMLVGLASQHEPQEHFGLDSRFAGGGRLVWKTSEPSLSVCCETHGRDRRQG
jgi:hypothetical protein